MLFTEISLDDEEDFMQQKTDEEDSKRVFPEKDIQNLSKKELDLLK